MSVMIKLAITECYHFSILCAEIINVLPLWTYQECAIHHSVKTGLSEVCMNEHCLN